MREEKEATAQTRRRQWLAILALGIAALAQCWLLDDHRDAGLILFALAAPMLVIALTGPSSATRLRPALGERRPWRLARLGWAALAIGSNAAALYFLWQDDTSLAGLVLWLASLALVTLAAPASPRLTPQLSRLAPHASLLLAALLLLAAFLRLYRIHDLPPGIFIDETNAALNALQILDGQPVSPFATGWFETPNLYVYYVAGVFRLLGVSFFALKWLSILPGLLTVASLYPLARRAFGPLAALSSLFLLATARWHVHMSRWGWNALLPPLCQVLVAYLLLRGLETERPRDFALAGLALGLSQYTYLAARLIPLTVALFLLHQTLTGRRFLRRHAANLILLAWVSLMAFAPLGLTYLRRPFLFFNRARQVSLLNDLAVAGSLDPLRDNAVEHLLMFNYQGDANPRHNLPGAPMLDPFAAALLPLAVGYALYRWRDRRYALLLLWIGVTLLGGVLSAAAEAPQGYRTLGAMPAVALLVGDLLARLWRRLASPGGKLWRGAVAAALVAGLDLSGYHNFYTYFITYAQDPHTVWGFTPFETGVARAAAAALDTHDVYVAPKLAYFSSLRFATYRRPDQGGGGLAQPPYGTFLPTTDLPLPPSNRDALIVLETQYLSLLSFVTHYYPSAAAYLHRAPDGQPLYLTVEISRQAQANAATGPPPGQGLLGSYFRGEAWQGQPVVQRIDPLLLFHWYGNEPLPNPFSVRWEGEILLPADGAYALTLVGDDGVRLWLDGALVGESLQPDTANVVEAHLELSAGAHPIRVEYFQRGGSKLLEFRWERPGATLELVPPEAFRPLTR